MSSLCPGVRWGSVPAKTHRVPRRPALTLVFLLSSAAIARAEANPFQPRPILRIDGVRFDAPPKVRLLVTDLDEQGRTRPPSVQRDYQLQVNGLPEQALPKITTIGEAGEPVSITFVVQLGPSMESVLSSIKKAIEEIVGGVSPSSTIRIVGYADQVKSDVTATTPADARKAVEALAIQPDALEMQLADAVQQSLKPASSVVVIFSDGTSPDLNQQKFTELGWHAKEKSVRIHTVGYAPIDDVPLKSTLSVLSKKTQGTERAARSEDELKDVLRALADEIRHQRILEYELPKLFTGQQYDFQISVGDVASEPVAQIVPQAETGGGAPTKTIVLVLSLGVSFALAGFGVMMVRRKKLAAKPIAPTPAPVEPPPPEDPRDKTMHGMRRPRDIRTPVQDPKPKIMAPPPEAPKPKKLEKSEELDTLPPQQVAPPPPVIEAPPPVTSPFAKLPSATAFLKKVKGPEPEPAPVPKIIDPPPRIVDPPAKIIEAPQRGPIESEDLDSTMPIAKADLKRELEASPEVAPRFTTHRTQVIAADELETIDVAGWLVPMPEGSPAIVLESGCVIGANGGKFRVRAKGGAPSEARFELNPLGRWVMFVGEDTRQLEDGASVEIGDTKFVYKYAARYPVDLEEKAPYLQIVGGLDDGRHIRLADGPRIIGSHPSASAIVRGAGVAPRHAVARLAGTICEIADLDSNTSLKAHGESVLVTKLEPNDEVQLGSVRLVFKVPSR